MKYREQLNDNERTEAGRLWEMGGSLALGHYFARLHKLYPQITYGELVKVARFEVRDNTDYSISPVGALRVAPGKVKDTDDDTAAPARGEG